MTHERTSRKTILLVAPDPEDRDELGAWLEDEGFEIEVCPGPEGERGCVGLREGSHCALTEAADLVILDHRTLQETELTIHYLMSGRPIVSLGRRAPAVELLGRSWIMHVPRADRPATMEAIRRLLPSDGVAPLPRSPSR